ncbi:hypothetical protein QQZ08_010029 [Neonectria magnoliae]|uniref:Amino acid transporter n=1 Tax=Neonectria magnoliae TaxID=2732573 RepID=A0ABR1HJT4_9HYPO
MSYAATSPEAFVPGPLDLDFREHFDRLNDANRADLERKMEPQTGWQVSPDPMHKSLLAPYAVAAIIANRMIGTGIFETPTHVLKEAPSIGLGLMFWLIGSVATLCGSLVCVEYGLTIPRYSLEGGRDGCIPCNGGELNYLQYLIPKPRYLAAFLFGVPFVVIGNSSPNAIAFARSLLDLAGIDKPDPSTVAFIAIAAVGLACLIHGIYRGLGVKINNAFALVKVLFLLVVIIGSLSIRAGVHTKTVAATDSPVDDCRSNATRTSNFDEAFNDFTKRHENPTSTYLQILFTFGGWNQANYVLSEVRNPHRSFKRTSLTTVSVICVLYMLVNVSYVAVVPVRGNEIFSQGSDDSCKDWSVASEFFQLTFGSREMYRCFLMISSLGNIVVTTFTAARVKQEIAKTGILPYAPVFARDYDMVTKVRGWAGLKQQNSVKHRTPAAALGLHFVFSVVLIFCAWPGLINGQAGYIALTSIYSYIVDAFYTTCLGLGIICMRLCGNKTPMTNWNMISATKSSIVSIVSALGTFLANGMPLVATWIGVEDSAYIGPAAGLGLLGLSILCWVLFRTIWVKHLEFVVKREPVYQLNDDGIPIRAFDTYKFGWFHPGGTQ